jgi:hypothetical protein
MTLNFPVGVGCVLEAMYLGGALETHQRGHTRDVDIRAMHITLEM